MVCDWPQPQPSCLLKILGFVVSGVPYRSLKREENENAEHLGGSEWGYCKISLS
jgi:hypothetical protein